MATTLNKPAILGGTPIFSHKLPIVKPSLPDLSTFETEVEEVLNTGMLTKGKYLVRFEQALAEHLQVPHVVAVSSCTVGLALVYRCLGIKGTILTPSFTFMATVSSMLWAGATPYFVDVDPRTTNIDPALLEKSITPDTDAIVAVHNFGNPAAIEQLEQIASRHNLKLIFDAAHAFGSLYKGTPVGCQGDAQVYSLSPTKLVIAGEGGVIATPHASLAEKLRIAREYGNDGTYNSLFAGLNARMPEFNAVLGYHSLQQLPREVERRNHLAATYRRLLQDTPGISFQQVHPADRSSYKDFSIVIDQDQFGLTRDQLAEALQQENIDTRKYYHPPVHRHTAYAPYYDGNPLPATDYLSANSLSLPLWSKLQEQDITYVCEAIHRIHKHSAEIKKRLSTTQT